MRTRSSRDNSEKKPDTVTETEGQIWDPKGAITAACITLNRHAGTAERASWANRHPLWEQNSSANKRRGTFIGFLSAHPNIQRKLAEDKCGIASSCPLWITVRRQAHLFSCAHCDKTNTPGDKAIWRPPLRLHTTSRSEAALSDGNIHLIPPNWPLTPASPH